MFKTPLVIQEIDSKHRNWILVEDLVYRGNKDKFVIHGGFVTDFASVPRIFWSLISPWGRQLKAAIVHDYLYTTGVVSRKDADGLFYRMMKELGVGWMKRQAIYRSVRIFGSKYYKG